MTAVTLYHIKLLLFESQLMRIWWFTGFTSWLNFILTPPDDSDVAASGSAPTDRGDMVVGTNNARKSQPLAPSREDLSLRAYTAKRKMTRLRRSACLLYQSEPLICVIRRIEAEVEEGRIAIRADKKLHADLGKNTYKAAMKPANT